MTVKNATAAITRGLKEAATLSLADMERVIADLTAANGPSDALVTMAYVEGIYHAIEGEDRRYMTAKLKQMREALAQRAAPPEPIVGG